MSAYFSYLVDELADIEERLCQSDVAPLSTALRRAVSSAYVQALLASQQAALAVEAAGDPAQGQEPASFQPKQAA